MKNLKAKEVIAMAKKKKCALFIDCENIPAHFLPQILKKLEKKYKVNIKKAYADWSLPSSWRQETLDMAGLEPIQVFHKGRKNSSDIRMCLDCLELAYKGKIDVFSIVTGDSDFRHLVHKLIKKDIKVIGFGTQKTADDFKLTYSKFYLLKRKDKAINKASKQSKELLLSAPKSMQAIELKAPKALLDNNPNAVILDISSEQVEQGGSIKCEASKSITQSTTLNYQKSSLLDKYKAYKTRCEQSLNEILLEIIWIMLERGGGYMHINELASRINKAYANRGEQWSVKMTGFGGWASLLKNTDEIFELKYDRPDERIGMRIKLRSEAINEL